MFFVITLCSVMPSLSLSLSPILMQFCMCMCSFVHCRISLCSLLPHFLLANIHTRVHFYNFIMIVYIYAFIGSLIKRFLLLNINKRKHSRLNIIQLSATALKTAIVSDLRKSDMKSEMTMSSCNLVWIMHYVAPC